MSLLDDAMQTCTLFNRVIEPDGYGGYVTNWYPGAEFESAVVLDSSIQARFAQSQGLTSVYTITTRKSITLGYHDVFRRESDGKIFRVTSDGTDKKTPDRASLNMRQVTAEEWSLPDGQS